MTWRYADRDEDALRELEERIEEAGRAQELITYSELVEGIEFNLDNVARSPFTIDVHAWDEFDRQVVGDFLGAISARSYLAHGIFASALVVSAGERTPGVGYVNLLKQVGLVPRNDEMLVLEVWTRHVQHAFEHYSRDPAAEVAGTPCLECGQPLAPLVFGYPSPETQQAAERGEISLGGCVMWVAGPAVECSGGHVFTVADDGGLVRFLEPETDTD